MRILHLANHCDEIGNGIINVAVDLACRQAELGHDVAFASGGGSYVPLMAEYGVAHVDLEQPWRRPVALAAATWKLRALLRDWQPDIIHAHMMTGAVLGRVLRRRSRCALVTHVHNEWQRSAVLMGVGDRVIAVSAAVAAHIERRGVPKKKICVVLNGPLNSPRRFPSIETPTTITLKHPSIVFVGGINVRKGIGELIEAFEIVAARFSSARLYLVGNGPDREVFEKQARSSPFSDRIQFTGFAKDPTPYLEQADIFVLPSRKDPCPLVLAEAREAGCAIVASDVDGIPEILENGRAGILVPPRRPDRLGEILVRLLTDPRERETWRAAARQNIRWLRTTRVAEDTLQIYASASGVSPPPAADRLTMRSPVAARTTASESSDIESLISAK